MGGQKPEQPLRHLCVGLLAHVDAGKTTLSEALLYESGGIRKLGRVDQGDAFLDNLALERARGITIFSKQAVLTEGDTEVTLMDTPGHADFSAEMERTLQVLDLAVLVISGSEGVQSHTEVLWNLLARYRVPTVFFVNKMDLASRPEKEILQEIRKKLGANAVDFTAPGSGDFFENVAAADEDAMEEYFADGEVSEERIRAEIADREIFPCWFGSALRDLGVGDFLRGLVRFAPDPVRSAEFGAKVFKIMRDREGKRLTFLRITGGILRVREEIGGEKISGIRVYSGEKYRSVPEADAGTVCAVLGLTGTRPGMGLGHEADSVAPALEPMMTYRLILPPDTAAAQVLPKLRELEEEVPEMHLVWDEEKGEIHVQIMGTVQMEILADLMRERTGLAVSFGERSVVYRETIADTVEGVGHFEPLRHYAEVHLLLEPGERGSGLVFDDRCDYDTLAGNWHRLILQHLGEREHRGVLTGSPITDMKITLMSGRASIKHTEGGDFRQAVYRAVRQGLMEAESVLLEPYCRFILEIPENSIGRAMTDLGRLSAKFDPPEISGARAVIRGRGPAAGLDAYQADLTAYTAGRGHLTCIPDGYDLCHNAEEVIAARGYDPELDLRNPSGSVFCTHGAGFYVPWNEVKDYMHLESCFSENSGKLRGEGEVETAAGTIQGGDARSRRQEEQWIGTDEVDAILDRTYNANRKRDEENGRNRWGARKKPVKSGETIYRAPEGGADRQSEKAAKKAAEPHYLLVDGYNVIFSWEELNSLAKANIDSARDRLLDILCNYQGYTKDYLIIVFDAYRVQGHRTEFFDFRNIHVVFTKEAETADQYIEKFTHENARRHNVTVATSDGLEQVIIRGQGAALISSREFEKEVHRVEELIRAENHERAVNRPNPKNYLLDGIDEETRRQLK
ncbi:translation factor GTPase family protein [Clostridium vitabionis]|uniref:translation factor GTPase family protein n=1 Tax=Clostridium vitabionis TaxID=2784388 RepID=UPI00188D55BA|nr:TetM/TetW/TetO/TetS family tetracycline resistance ribosomal protection protein [Clostridium vitabionis]